MSLILPRRFTSQPQGAATVDWSNPITRGLRALFDSSTGREVISNSWPSSDTSVRQVSTRGIGRAYANTETRYAHRSAYAQTGALTLVALVDIRSLTGYSPIISKQSSAVANCPYEWRLGGLNPDSADFLLLRATASDYRAKMTSESLIAPGFSGVIGVTAASGDLWAAGAAWVNGVRHPFVTGYGVGVGFAEDNGASEVLIGGRQDGATHLDGQIYFVAVYERELSEAEMRSLSDNAWQLFKAPARELWLSGASASAFALAGVAQAVASASGALSVAVPMVGAALGVTTANGALSTAMKLSGSAAAASSASGTLTLGVVLSGAAIAQAVVSGVLGTRFALSGAAAAHAGASGSETIAVALAGSAAGQGGASANLTAAAPSVLAGAAIAHAAVTGAMTIQFALSGAALAQVSASGALSVGGSNALAGTAQAVAAASGSLSMSLPLAGSAQVVVGASGNLGSGKPLAGAAVSVAAAGGNLTATVRLSGAAVAQAIASGGLMLRFALSGAAFAHAAASGTLSSGDAPYVGDPRYTVRRAALNNTVIHAH